MKTLFVVYSVIVVAVGWYSIYFADPGNSSGSSSGSYFSSGRGFSGFSGGHK
jgi:uncharacterized sodium:solute symporter family permease YidK